jgi:hypothetical protein
MFFSLPDTVSLNVHSDYMVFLLSDWLIRARRTRRNHQVSSSSEWSSDREDEKNPKGSSNSDGGKALSPRSRSMRGSEESRIEEELIRVLRNPEGLLRNTKFRTSQKIF